jgi:hypothetical protein
VLIGAVLLVDGRLHKSTLEMMQEEAACELVINTLWHGRSKDHRLHRIYLELLYEMCRVQKINRKELEKICYEFIKFMFDIIEEGSGNHGDGYNYTAMKVLLALNEQFMVADYDNLTSSTRSICNLVFEVLKKEGNRYRTFGENIVFLMNRGIDNILQLMMLKLLYLTFTHEETFQYLYLNDLKVLVGVIIRELYDLPDEEEKLRHTYLRILHPLL